MTKVKRVPKGTGGKIKRVRRKRNKGYTRVAKK